MKYELRIDLDIPPAINRLLQVDRGESLRFSEFVQDQIVAAIEGWTNAKLAVSGHDRRHWAETMPSSDDGGSVH